MELFCFAIYSVAFISSKKFSLLLRKAGFYPLMLKKFRLPATWAYSHVNAVLKHAKLAISSVSPVLFLFTGAFNTFQVLITTGIHWKLCEQKYGDVASVDCRNVETIPDSVELEFQQQSSQWNSIDAVGLLIPLLIVGPIYGAFGDRNGRKINILTGTTGLILYSLLGMFEFYFVEMPILTISILSFFISWLGFSGTVVAACFAYVADETKDEKLLTLRFTVIQVVTATANILFGFLTGAIVDQLSYVQLTLLTLLLFVVAFFYALAFLKQTPPKQVNLLQLSRSVAPDVLNTPPTPVPDSGIVVFATTSHASLNEPLFTTRTSNCCFRFTFLRQLRNLLESTVKTVRKTRRGHLNAYIWIVLAIFVVMSASGSSSYSILYLYCLRSPLLWTPGDIAFYNSCSSLMSLFGTVVAAALLKRFPIVETLLLLSTLVSSCLQFLLIGFGSSMTLMYTASVLGTVSGLMLPLCKSLTAQFVEKQEIGKIYALYDIASTISTALSYIMLQGLYGATVAICPGLVFFVMSGILLAVSAPTLWMHFDYAKFRRNQVIVQPVLSQ